MPRRRARARRAPLSDAPGGGAGDAAGDIAVMTQSDDRAHAGSGRRLATGSRLVIGIIVYGLIFGLALSLTIRYVVHHLRDTIERASESEAGAAGDEVDEAK